MKRAVAVLLGLIAVGLVVLLTAGKTGSTKHEQPAAPRRCEGAAALCKRHLNEVLFAGTHNSYAASAQPGWHFASQRYGISRQLDSGIRALLLDVHFGIYDRDTGRVRTDLSAEGSDRNKVAKQVPPRALSLADRLVGRVGVGRLQGTPELYLCHTLCELGADPLNRELKAIASFLAQHRDEVLIVIVEDYIPPAAIARAFAQAGLERYVATLDRHAPLPTLGELIAQDRRLVVFAEKDAGTPAWYMPAFSFIQDTPLGALRPDQLSCKHYRGETDSPLLLINHWIPPFPPSQPLNAAIGRTAFLRRRVERCLKQRGSTGAIVAVDFYQRTSVVAVAKELNERSR
ncbi:MAG TPA: hypothetical protein VGL37_01150 [Solirubrobacteraceae bacterium]